jgi:hypothetical protein
MGALIDFPIQAVRGIARPPQSHLMVELVAVDPFPVYGSVPVNGQEKIFLTNRGRGFVKNLRELLHVDPQMRISTPFLLSASFSQNRERPVKEERPLYQHHVSLPRIPYDLIRRIILPGNAKSLRCPVL